jgi:hypothetical protein
VKCYRLRWLLPVTLIFTACSTAVPRQELQRANAAYDAVASSSEPMLADLAVAERRLFLRLSDEELRALKPVPVSVRRAGGVVVPEPDSFDPRLVAYFTPIEDPALTAAIRRALSATGSYFKTLTTLAEGGNITEAKSNLAALGRSVSGLASLANVSGLPIGAAVNALQDAVELWLRAENMEELKRLVLEGEPKIDELLAKLQDSAGTVYRTLASGPDRAFAESENETEKRVLVAQMAEANLKVSNYVLLLAGLREATQKLADAVRSGGSSASLASLSASSETLLSDAMAASRAIAMFRARGVEP